MAAPGEELVIVSVNDFSGYKAVPERYDVKRWQHRLFVEIRRAPVYRSIGDEIRVEWEAAGRPGERTGDFNDPNYWMQKPLDPTSDYFKTLARSAVHLGLARNGRAATWSIQYLHDDVLGSFHPNRLPRMPEVVRSLFIEVSISPASMAVETYRDLSSIDEEVRASYARHQRPMMVGEPEWQELERMAVEAARQAVSDLKESYTHYGGRSRMTKIKAGYEEDREIQISRLALRLTGRSGTRNTVRIDRGWCQRLGIDVPAQR